MSQCVLASTGEPMVPAQWCGSDEYGKEYNLRGQQCASGFRSFAHGCPFELCLSASGNSLRRCVLEENPSGGFNSFDNFWMASWTIFQCSTLEGWTDVMEMLMQVSNAVLVIALTGQNRSGCGTILLDIFSSFATHFQLHDHKSIHRGHQSIICRGAPC